MGVASAMCELRLAPNQALHVTSTHHIHVVQGGRDLVQHVHTHLFLGLLLGEVQRKDSWVKQTCELPGIDLLTWAKLTKNVVDLLHARFRRCTCHAKSLPPSKSYTQ